MLIYPLLLDAEQLAGDVLALLSDASRNPRDDLVVIRARVGVSVRWYLLPASSVRTACAQSAAATTMAVVCDIAHGTPIEACELGELPRRLRMSASAPMVVVAGERVIGVHRGLSVPSAPPAPPSFAVPSPAAAPLPPPPPVASRGDESPPPVGSTPGFTLRRGQRAKPPIPAIPAPATVVSGVDRGVERGIERGVERGVDRGMDRDIDAPVMAGAPAPATDAPATDTLLAVARVEFPLAIVPAADAHATLTIGLASPPQDATDVLTFVSAKSDTTLAIGVMVEAPDFTCAAGWKYTLVVNKSDPFSTSVTLDLSPVNPTDRTVRVSTLRVHYTYNGQPAGVATRTVCLGDATSADVASVTQPRAAALQIAPTEMPVDLTIRIARRDQSDTAQDLIWTITDCAFPITLPAAPIVQKVGDRDTASSFASKVTNQVNAADGTVTIDNMMRSIGTLVRRAMPAEALKALNDVAAAVGTSRLARVLLLTDESHVPWELALLDPAPNPTRAPYLGAQFAISRWLHSESDVPVPPPATLTVSNLAVVLGNYDASSLAALPHAKEESLALSDEATHAPTLFPRVTSVDASPDALVDLLNGSLPSSNGPLAPEMVHFACHGEVLGTGVSKRSVLYMSDGSPLSEMLFVSSELGKTKKSFLFMNACQVGVGGEELGQYAGFPGMAIGAGFSGFIGPLWSVNDQIAKSIAVDFYQRAFGADGSAPKPVADILADMRSQYASEPDPKKRSATWLAYVHYGHPQFTFAHA